MSHIIFQYPIRDGMTGLELEAVRHQYSRVTPSYGASLVSAVLAALDEAATHAEVECKAAVKIQAAYRMHRQVKAFQAIRQKACTIQRIYRGYATRQRLARERWTLQQLTYLQTVFDMFATRIQACYRGHRSRKTTSNYYAQRAYIQTVTARAADVLADAHRTRGEQDELRNAEAQRVHALAYARRTAQMHHTVSTCSIASVYQRVPARLVSSDEGDADGDVSNSDSQDGTSNKKKKMMTSGESAQEDDVLAQVAVFTAGEKLEDDIRQNARAARHDRSKKRNDRGAEAATAASSQGKPPSVPEAKKKLPQSPLPAAANSVESPRLPNLNASSRLPKRAAAANSRAVEETGVSTSASSLPQVPWEAPTARAPQRPLVAQSFSNSAPAAKRGKTHTQDGGNAAAGVSSFHRKFGVKRHDCIEHDFSCNAGVSQNGAATAAAATVNYTGPLSNAKEKAAFEHEIDQKLIKSVHGDAVFKVPAARGKRT